MSTSALAPRTHLPASATMLREVGEALHAEGEFALVGPAGRVPLPPEVHAVLTQVVDAMLAGKAVHVAPSDQMLTTQQAADLLGISRPTVTAIIDRGELQHEMVGTHRRVRLGDVLDYRDRRRERQRALLAEMQAELDDDRAATDVERQLRDIRKRVAARRRTRQAM